VAYQDAGRFGMMRFGVPASGPMDRLAHAAAHAALGQPQDGTAIEISMGGLELACESGEVTFCIAGGGFQVRHAGVVSAPWCVRTLRAGDVLSVRPGPWGSWAYLAFCGDLLCERWAGSASTHSTSGLGGGRLTGGAAVVVRNASVCEARQGDLLIPDFARPRQRARVVPGPQTAQFVQAATEALFNEAFTVTAAFDRMGMRLAGLALPLKDALSIPSEPIIRGSMQVGGDGVMSVLLADHQTTGGYPKIATIVSADIDAVSQLRPQDSLRFQSISAEEGIQLTRAHERAKRHYLERVSLPGGSLDERLMRENLISGVV
jgi:biotin-dependent carboxylase-like uncharacterized protein